MMLLLPGSLPTDRATLNALCENLPSHLELAKWSRACEVETVDGSWSEWERKLSPLPFKGRVRAGMGFPTIQEPNPIPLPASPLKGEESHAHLAIATPLHATLGLTDLTPLDPSHLQLSENDSRALCEACHAHLREDGVHLEFVSADEWRAFTQREIRVLTERPDWIIGESMRPNLPRGEDGRLVERWMNELQMLLFNHPVNTARAERKLPPVNVVWLWGFDGLNSVPGDHTDGRMLKVLRNGDVASWQRAWCDLESKILAGNGVVMGDSKPRLKLTKRNLGFVERLRMKFASQKLSDVLAVLQAELPK